MDPSAEPELSPLESEVLEEYERLADNMKNLATILDTMSGQPPSQILDGLRELERKTSLVFTLLKASVYSIVLQQEINNNNDGGGGGNEGRHDDGHRPLGSDDDDDDDDMGVGEDSRY